MRIASRLFLGAMLLVAAALPQAVAAAGSPTELVRDTAERMMQALERNKAAIDADPAKIYGMVRTIVVPHFDFDKITQAAMGKHWRKASAAQKQEMVTVFRERMVRIYANALRKYTNQEVRYLPETRRPAKGNRPERATVPTEITERGAPPTPVEYKLYQTGSGWLVYDVSIDGASLVSSARGELDALVRREGGIDGLIRRLKEENRKGA